MKRCSRWASIGTGANQLDRQRIDTGHAGELVGGNPRQSPVERRRQVVVNIFRRRRHDVEIVEEPFSCGRQGLLVRVLRKLLVDVAERVHVPVELPEVRVPRDRTARHNREQSRKSAGMFL